MKTVPYFVDEVYGTIYSSNFTTASSCASPVQLGRSVVQRYAYVHVPDKSYCYWCHGWTVDDYIGHCAGCGGPREQYQHG